MIEVMVGVHEVPNRLVRREPVHFRHHRQRPLLIHGSLDDRDEIAKLHGHAVVRAAAQEPHAVGELLRFHADRRGRRAHRVRDGHGGNGDVRLYPAHPDLHHVVPRIQPIVALMVMDDGGELHAAEVLVGAVPDLVQHVPEHRVGHAGLDEFDHILIVNRAAHPVLPQRGKRDLGDSSSPRRPCHGRRVRARRQRGFDEAVRRQHDIQLPQLRNGDAVEIPAHDRDRIVPLHVPGVIAAENEIQPLVSLDRRATAALGRVGALPPGGLLP